MPRTAFRTCPLCEATCGLRLTIEGDSVISVRGDDDDVFSRGFVCPKGVAIGELHHDPDRIRYPLVRGADGRHRRASWDEAWAEIARLLGPVRAEHGNDAVGVYLGNPNVHNLSSSLYAPALIRALGTRSIFSASTVDQMPQQVAVGLLYGTGLSVTVPDIDRTDYALILGANPLVSNGSMWTAPDMPRRLRALKARGGRLVVVDPVRTRTAEAADEHIAIRPGADGFLVAAIVHGLFAESLADPGAAGDWLADGALEALEQAAQPFTPAAVARLSGVPADTIVRLARELAAAPAAFVYGRMGTSTAGLAVDGQSPRSFGTAASWWIAIANLLTGNVDRPGGVMWPLPAAGGPTTSGTPGTGRGIRIPGGHRSRVRDLPSVLGELPAAALAEEIDTPASDGTRIRALITIAGNPVLSTPDGGRLAAALGTLEAMVSIDAYATETSRHAHVILPAPSPLARAHFDLAFSALSVRNVAHWSPPSVGLRSDEEAAEQDEGDIVLRLACVALGDAMGIDALDEAVALEAATRACRSEASRVHGREPAELVAATAPRRRQERLLDLLIRSGPYGDGFGSHPGGLTLADLEAAPHGIDLGPLQPRLPEVLRTPGGRIDAAAPQLLAEATRMATLLAQYHDHGAGRARPGGLVLVGRRGLRSNNSWMHNIPLLAGGSNRCTLWVHPDDATAHSLADGTDAVLCSGTGEVRVAVEVTDAVAPGVVCLPHGWGHSGAGTWGSVAAAAPGVNANLLTPSVGIDPLSGTAVLNGIPVTVRAA
ncbi:MAG: molybdopterin-dependent oxidoreductase [Candidatus Nanopelagicales bacterium]